MQIEHNTLLNPNENLSVQEIYDELIFYTSVASNQFIKIFDVLQIKNSTAPWLKDELKALIRKKKNLRYKNCARKWKDIILIKEYRLICKLVRSEIKKRVQPMRLI
jgi:hypothetical protein